MNRLAPHQRRNIKKTIYVSVVEQYELCLKAQAANLPLATYMREAALGEIEVEKAGMSSEE